MKRLVLDMDNTLTLGREEHEDYKNVRPCLKVIEKVREYKQKGFTIVIFSSRNMRSYNNSVGEINAKTLPVMIDWLNEHKVPYDEIHIGKPWCGMDGFYVDDRAIRPDEFLKLSHDEILKLIGASD